MTSPAVPFTTTGTANGAVLISEVYGPGIVDAVYTNDWLSTQIGGRSIFPTKVWGGGTKANWLVRKAGNSSVTVFTEGEAQNAADAQSYAHAAVAWTYLRGMVQISGHALDAMRSNYASMSVVDSEIGGTSKDLGDLLCTSFLGSTYGLEVAIDNTTTYAGIARGSAAYFESTETDVSAKLAATDLLDLLETIRDNDKGGRPSCWLAPLNQQTNMYNLSGVPSVTQVTDQDRAPAFGNQSFGGLPIIAIGDMTDSLIVALDARPGQLDVAVIRPLQVKPMAPSGDSDIYQLSIGAALLVYSPKNSGKLVNLTS
jgi:hypothetical protein